MILTHSQQGRANKRAGSEAEQIVAQRLRSLGLVLVEKRQTGWTVIYGHPDPKTKKRRIAHVFPNAKVPGDFTAVAPGGRYVHCEAKHHSDPDAKLSLSDFQKDGENDANQIDALNAYAARGALSLVAWSCPRGVVILRWPIAGLAAGRPLSWVAASMMNLNTLPQRL